MVRQGFSDNTIKAFQADLRLFSRYTGANHAIGEIGQADLDQFLTWMRADRGVPCSPKTFARRMTTLKVFFGWLEESGAIPGDPAAPLVHQHPSTPLPDILYDDQMGALLGATRDLLWAPKPDARPYLLISLLLQTGIKKSECMDIRPEHIDFSNPQAPVLYIRYEDPRKTLKERKLALGPQFTPVYRQYLREYSPTERVFECTARNLEYVLEDAAKAGRHPRRRVVRATSLDVRRARLSQRDAVGPVAPEAGPVANQLARNPAQDSAPRPPGPVARRQVQRTSEVSCTLVDAYSPLLPKGSSNRITASYAALISR